MRTKFETIDEYIAEFSAEVQERLQELRKVIKENAPESIEKITWDMPTFFLHGNLVHFAAFKKHIGFYPGPSGIDAFEEETAQYRTAKGTMQFPMYKTIPYDLIKKIVKFRVEENIRIFESKNRK